MICGSCRNHCDVAGVNMHATLEAVFARAVPCMQLSPVRSLFSWGLCQSKEIEDSR